MPQGSDNDWDIGHDVERGESEDRRSAVAEVARTIFGDEAFKADQVIEERLTTCTQTTGELPGKEELARAVQSKVDPEWDSTVFVRHPLAIWLEAAVALGRTAGGEWRRGAPTSLDEIAMRLQEASGLKEKQCIQSLHALLRWAERLNIEGSRMRPRQSYLPYKIHQFISQTGNVYVTLDSKDKREVTLDPGLYIRTVVDGEPKDIPLFPVLFSRGSGYDFNLREEAGWLARATRS